MWKITVFGIWYNESNETAYAELTACDEADARERFNMMKTGCTIEKIESRVEYM